MDADTSGTDFAERLSLWVSAFDAIGLLAAQQSIQAITTVAAGKPSQARPTTVQALEQDFQRVRTALASAIAQDPVRHAAVAGAPAFFPYHQRHMELQRQMEQMIGPLRDHFRQALSRVSPRLRQLAALDAVLEQLLAPREQLLLPTVSHLMERRFEQLRLAQEPALEVAGPHDDPLARRQPDEWLDLFGNDWRQAVLAELDLRLEPLAGLIEALNHELKNQR